jgi:hypothetical protein
MANKTIIIAAIAIFTESTKGAPVFSDKKELDARNNLWWSLLQEIPDEIVMAASKQLAVENTFFPALAELRNKCIDLMKPKLPDWSEAWKECIAYLNKFSWEQKEGFSHQMIEEAYNRIGNWDNLQSDDVPTVRAQFRQTYEQLLYRAESDIKLLPEAKQVSEQYRLGVDSLVNKLEDKN